MFRRVGIEFTGSSRGVEAALNRINAGLGRTQQGTRQNTREMGLWQRQMMAIGTTARYYLAGQLVFGITAAIGRLTEFNNLLGTSAGLMGRFNSTTGNFQAPTRSAMEEVADDAVLQSNRIGIAAEDVMAYQQRFLSAFDLDRLGARQRIATMRRFVQEATQLQATLGAEAGDPQALAGGVASFVGAMPGGNRNIGRNTNRVASMITFLTGRTPNITGRDIARDIGRMQSGMTASRLTPEQLFAIWTQAGMSGGSASVISRGLTQLLSTSLLRPTSPAQRQAFQSIGLNPDPTQLRELGGWQVLMRMLHAVAPRGARIRNPRALADEDLGDEQAVGNAGVRGVNMTLLYNLLGRQESVRQFLSLLTQGGPNALERFVRSLRTAETSNLTASRFAATDQYRDLARFNEARRNLSLQFVRGLEGNTRVFGHDIPGPLNALAGGTRRLSDAMVHHPNVTRAIELAGVAYAGSRVLRGLIRGRGRNVPGSVAGAAVMAEEAPAVMGGFDRPDGSRANPLWVVISPWSGAFGTNLGGGNAPPGDPTNPMNALRRLPTWARGAAGGGALAALARSMGLVGGEMALHGPLAADLTAILTTPGARRQRRPMAPRGHLVVDGADRRQSLADLGRPDLAQPLLNALDAAHIRARDVQRFEFSGNAKADLTIKLVDASGRTIKVEEKKGVPITTKVIPARQYPTKKGKPRAR
jgi:hypothetical protein